MKRSISTKTVVILMAVVLLLGCTVGGSLAYLAMKTDSVENTFTTSDIDIDLVETPNTDNESWVGKMVPGTELDKDPKVIVEGGSEACWLFVKVDEGANVDMEVGVDTLVQYNVITGTNGWILLDGTTYVYYREVTASTDDQEFPILVDDKVTIPSGVTKQMLNNSTGTTLTFTAYAVQKENVDNVQDAWVIAQGLA